MSDKLEKLKAQSWYSYEDAVWLISEVERLRAENANLRESRQYDIETIPYREDT